MAIEQKDFFGEGFFAWQGSTAAVAEQSDAWHYDENKYWGGFARDIDRTERYPDWALGPFAKYEGNPVFAPDAASWDCGHLGGGVHNGSVVQKDGKFYYLYRGEHPHESVSISDEMRTGETELLVDSFDYICDIGVAVSADGVRFERLAGPLFRRGEEEKYSFEDVCCVRQGEEYFLFCNRWDWHNPLNPAVCGVYLATSFDLVNWQPRGLVFPEAKEIHRNACVVQNLHNEAVRVNGKYLMYLNNGLLAESEDLLHWTSRKVGVRWPGGEGCAAVTDLPGHEADIVLFTGGHHTGHFYAVGEVRFDRGNPERPLDWLNFPVLKCEPQYPWENGRSPRAPYNVVSRWRDTLFFTGLTERAGKIYLYYGGSEYYTCLATTDVKPKED